MSRASHLRLPVIGRLALSPLVERELRTSARRPLFFLAKNLVLIVWARMCLRRGLRLGRRTARLDASASRLVLQRA
jgi:hypothetical protein